jgi:hypothetical protein
MDARTLRLVTRLITFLFIHFPAQTSGQTRGLEPGDEVRIRWSSVGYSYGFDTYRVAVGDVVDYSGSHIMLRRGQRFFTVPMRSVRTLERRIGTKPASAPAMVSGSAAGFTAGFVVGVMTGGINGSTPGFDRVDAGLQTGVLIGAPIGAFVAWLASRSRGIYEGIPFGERLNGVSVDPRGGVAVSIRTGGR